MVFTIYLLDRSHAGIRRAGGEDPPFWSEMEFVLWYLIRALSEFYESPALLPDLLAAVYLDTGFLSHFLPGEDPPKPDLQERILDFRRLQREHRIAPYGLMTEAEMELEIQKEQREYRGMIGEINAQILQRPVVLDPQEAKESAKYIRAAFPECRVEFKGFGRFLGYSDLNQILFWTPLLVLQYFYRTYIPKGDEILAILTAVSTHAGLLHAGRRIAGDNHRELAAAGIRALMKKYVSS
jgi:hypothetical protein